MWLTPTCKPKSSLVVILLLSFALLPGATAFADQVSKISPDGTLVFSDGKKAVLAGIKMLPEFSFLLAALVSKKEVEAEYDDGVAPSLPAVYLYVQTEELQLPFKPIDQPTVQRAMINEILVQWGAATVNGGESRYRDKLLLLEKDAKVRGYGLWSYEPVKPKKNIRSEPKGVNA